MHQGKHQEYEKKLHDSLIAQQSLEEAKTSGEQRKKGANGTSTKRNGGKETWPSLTISPTSKSSQKSSKELQKPEAKVGKSDKSKSEKYKAEDSSEAKDSSEESNDKEDEATTPYGWTKLDEEDCKSEEETMSKDICKLKYDKLKLFLIFY